MLHHLVPNESEVDGDVYPDSVDEDLTHGELNIFLAFVVNSIRHEHQAIACKLNGQFVEDLQIVLCLFNKRFLVNNETQHYHVYAYLKHKLEPKVVLEIVAQHHKALSSSDVGPVVMDAPFVFFQAAVEDIKCNVKVFLFLNKTIWIAIH